MRPRARPHRVLLAACCALGPVALATPPPLPDTIHADGFEAACGQVLYADGFTSANGTGWPFPWVVAGNVALADVQSGEARLRPGPTGYSLARMAAPVATRDVDVRFVLRMEDATTQGVGFYVRQNGGYLTESNPDGAGYAVFVEGPFRGKAGVGVWMEVDGSEIERAHSTGVTGPASGSRYAVRFQVFQASVSSTTLRARFWPEGETEPAQWQVAYTDSTPSLQNLVGGLAVDSWSVLLNPTPITAHTFVDDIEVRGYCPP